MSCKLDRVSEDDRALRMDDASLQDIAPEPDRLDKFRNGIPALVGTRDG